MLKENVFFEMMSSLRLHSSPKYCDGNAGKDEIDGNLSSCLAFFLDFRCKIWRSFDLLVVCLLALASVGNSVV